MPTQDEIKAEFRKNLERVGWNELVKDKEVLDVLACHPKISGLDKWQVRKVQSPYRNGQIMLLVEYEDNREDFSWIKALEIYYGWSSNHRVAKNARRLIQDQIVEYKTVHNVPSGYDVDHVKQFKDLLNEFLITNEVKEITPEYELKWQEYHKENAILQALPKQQHKQLTKIRRVKQKC